MHSESMKLDSAYFDKMRIDDPAVRDWFRAVLASQTRDAQSDSAAQRSELQRQASLLVAQQDRLLNLNLAGKIDDEVSLAQRLEEVDDIAVVGKVLTA